MIKLLLATLLWGIGFVVIKVCMNYMNPYTFLAMRFIVGFAAVMLVYRKRAKDWNTGYIKNGWLTSVLLCISMFLQIAGCKYTSVGKNAFLSAIYVVLIPIICYVLYRERLRKSVIAAAVICMCGIAVMSLSNDFSINIGDILSLFSGIAYAFYFIMIDRNKKWADPVLLHMTMLGMGTIISIFIASACGNMPKQLNIVWILGVLYGGIFGVMVGFLLQIQGQQSVSPSIAGIVLALESVFGTIFAVILLHETLTLRVFLGAVMIFISIIIPNVYTNRK